MVQLANSAWSSLEQKFIQRSFALKSRAQSYDRNGPDNRKNKARSKPISAGSKVMPTVWSGPVDTSSKMHSDVVTSGQQDVWIRTTPTCHVVPYSNCCQSDDDKIGRFQSCPALNVFEDHSWYGDKQDASSQDEEQRGGHADFSLTDLVVLIL